MKTEYEIRILEINKEEIIKSLEKLGAVKKGVYNQKRYVYDLKPIQKNKWIRLRTNGQVTTLTYKDIESNTIGGTKELEIQVEDFEKTNEFLEKIGFINRNYQENNRIQYILNGVEIDIDSWPMIPTYLEIEGKNEESVFKVVDLLQIDKSKICELNCNDIYKEIYNIDISKIKELKFE
ncbi:MAG: CYTH domain-containing protein [Clostridia bacterium]|nr:CYTH domain-containing protein [Clostridia bacterium]